MGSIKDTTVVREATYFGRRAMVATHYLTSRLHGLRVVTTEWIDDADERNGGHVSGTCVIQVIDGDGRTSDFTVHSTEIKKPW